MILTSLVGMCLSSHGSVPWKILLFGNLGIALASASAAAINHLADYRIDKLMVRTKQRPVVTGKVSMIETLIFAVILCLIAMTVLVLFVNTLTAELTFLSMIGYAGVYTFYLKHRTPQNIVIGGLAGAAPPMLGSVAVTGHVDATGLILLLIIFIWTPPHFWALAIDRIDDYAKANVPMLPNIKGIPHTKKCILIYSFLLSLLSLIPFYIGTCYAAYIPGIIAINIWFLYHVINLYFDPLNQSAKKVFYNSIIYLSCLFIVLLLSHIIPL